MTETKQANLYWASDDQGRWLLAAKSDGEALDEAGEEPETEGLERTTYYYVLVRAQCALCNGEGPQGHAEGCAHGDAELLDETVTVRCDPEEPPCMALWEVEDEDAGHDWRAAHAIVGGLRENPGVWGSGGGVVSTEVCIRCGAARRTDTWGDDGRGGHAEVVSFVEDQYADEVQREADTARERGQERGQGLVEAYLEQHDEGSEPKLDELVAEARSERAAEDDGVLDGLERIYYAALREGAEDALDEYQRLMDDEQEEG